MTRHDPTRQVSVTPEYRPAYRTRPSRPSAGQGSAEGLLREMAFTLHAVRTVRESMTGTRGRAAVE